MKTGIIQQHNTADREDNMARLAEKITKLAHQGAELIVLQELHNGLYFCQTEDVNVFDQAEPIPGPSTEFFGRLARELQVVIVTSLFERRAAGLYHNTAVVIERDGTIAGRYRKMHIPDDPGYYEKFYFTPGDLGFQPIQTSVGRLGVLVCWDQWYPEAARLMALAGAELLIYPTAIGYDPNDTPEEQQRQRMAWQTVQRGHAVANGLPVVTVNRVGGETSQFKVHSSQFTVDSSNFTVHSSQFTVHSSQLNHAQPNYELCTMNCELKQQFWGTSFVAGPQGELLYEAPEDEEAEAVVDVDMQRSEQVRRWWPFLRDRRIEAYDNLTKRFID